MTDLNNKRDVENIRRKNIEDNQKFLNQLRINDIRNDFIQSARAMLPKKENIKHSVEHIKVEYPTRYSEKVKSGKIPAHVPEWQQKIQRKLLMKEQKEKLRQERLAGNRELPDDWSEWTLFYENNAHPYQRVFKPRKTKTSERVEREIAESLKEDNI